MVVDGKVTKITNFGVFIEILDGLEGLLHVSEISDQPIEARPLPNKARVKNATANSGDST